MEWMYVLGFSALLIALWVSIVSLLLGLSGMKREIQLPAGQPLDTMSMGSAKINGVRFRNALKAEKYSSGVLLSTPKLLGGGHLWLSKEVLRDATLHPKGFLRPPLLEANGPTGKVKLYDGLAEFASVD